MQRPTVSLKEVSVFMVDRNLRSQVDGGAYLHPWVRYLSLGDNAIVLWQRVSNLDTLALWVSSFLSR